MFVTDNQGDWIQVCKMAHVQQGRFYGHPEYKENALPEGKFPDGHSVVWMPYQRSKSISGPVCDKTDGKFGPFNGQMFVGDVGYGANVGIMRIALEKVGGEYQGAIFPFVDRYPLGCERLKFGPDHSIRGLSDHRADAHDLHRQERPHGDAVHEHPARRQGLYRALHQTTGR